MVYYVLVSPGSGRGTSAGRSVAAYLNEADVSEVMKKCGTQITEAQFMDLYWSLYKVSPDFYIETIKKSCGTSTAENRKETQP